MIAIGSEVLVRWSASGEQVRAVNLPLAPSHVLASPDGDIVVVGCESQCVIMRLSPEGLLRWRIALEGAAVSALDTDGRGRTLLLIDSRAVILDSAGQVRLDKALDIMPSCAALGAASTDFVVGGWNREANRPAVERVRADGSLLWRRTEGTGTGDHALPFDSIAFGADDSIAFTGSYDNGASVFLAVLYGYGESRWRLGVEPEATVLGFTADNRVVLRTSSHWGSTFSALAPDGALVWQLDIPSFQSSEDPLHQIHSAALARDGSLVLSMTTTGNGEPPPPLRWYSSGTHAITVLEP